MCYNDFNGQTFSPCRIKITTTADGVDGDVYAEGRYAKCGGGVKVCYVLNGDESSFFFREDNAEYIRKGAQYVRMNFEAGKSTLAEIGSGEMRGTFEIKTRKLQTLSDGSGYKVSLLYEIVRGGEEVGLSFTVFI